jgi:4-amino-4-deoxy-L-arabinose transferase-like glycosyltransferase
VKYKQKTILLIIIAALVRLIVAASIGLGNDEVYYVSYAQHLQWNYFDHPPMVALWIKLSTINLYVQQYELFVRLGSVLSAAGCTWLLYKTANMLHSAKAGWVVSLLYSGSVYASVIAGTFILPDSPQILFWCWALYLATKILLSNGKGYANWLLFGVAAGLCVMSKIHGCFLWFGLGLYVIIYKRDWLKLPQLYLAFLITLLIVSPIFIWNWQNDFITWRYHSQRVVVEQFSFNKDGFLRELMGQLLYNNPFNVCIVVAALISFKTKKLPVTAPVNLYLLIGLPMIFLLLGIAAFRDTLPHWSGPAWCTLLLPAAVWMAGVDEKVFVKKLRLAKLGILLQLVIIVAGVAVVNFYPGTIGSNKNTDTMGDGDATLDMYGWKNFATSFDSLRRADIVSGKMKADAGIVCSKWFPAAHIDYYVTRYKKSMVTGLGNLNDLHHYQWLNSRRDTVQRGSDAWCIVPSNNAIDVQQQYASSFNAVEKAATIASYRSGKIVRYFVIYRLRNRK